MFSYSAKHGFKAIDSIGELEVESTDYQSIVNAIKQILSTSEYNEITLLKYSNPSTTTSVSQLNQ